VTQHDPPHVHVRRSRLACSRERARKRFPNARAGRRDLRYRVLHLEAAAESRPDPPDLANLMSSREDRCPPVPLWLQDLIPKGTYRLFMFAASDGRTMNPRGTFDRLQRDERPIGVRVSKIHRDRTLERLTVGLRWWQMATRSWAAAGIAHQCANERVFLLLQLVADDICPDCKANLSFVAKRTATSSRRTQSSSNTLKSGNPSTGNTERGNPEVQSGLAVEDSKAQEAIQKSPLERWKSNGS